MEEEEHTDRKQQLAAISQKLNKIRKSLDEGMQKISIQKAALLVLLLLLLLLFIVFIHYNVMQLF